MGLKSFRFDAENLTQLLGRTVPDNSKKFTVIRSCMLDGQARIEGALITHNDFVKGKWFIDERDGSLWWLSGDDQAKYYICRFIVSEASKEQTAVRPFGAPLAASEGWDELKGRREGPVPPETA